VETETGGRWFVLSVSSAETGCPILEERIYVTDLDLLRRILGEDCDDGAAYGVDEGRLGMIIENFGAGKGLHGQDVTLEPWSSTRGLPYLVHTRFELFLMLEGRKPLAAFCDAPDFLDELLRPFAVHVDAGALRRRSYSRSVAFGGRRQTLQEAYFALPGEEWRIAAYRRLMAEARRSGWNAAMERRQGELLGYQDWQNDRWADWAASRDA
jgi:hypothetical protein